MSLLLVLLLGHPACPHRVRDHAHVGDARPLRRGHLLVQNGDGSRLIRDPLNPLLAHDPFGANPTRLREGYQYDASGYGNTNTN